MKDLSGSFDAGLASLKKIFLGAAVLFLVLVTLFTLVDRKRRVLEKRQKELTRAEEGLKQVQKATLNRRQALNVITSLIPPESRVTSPEKQIYGKIDEIRTKLKADDMTIKPVERKEGNATLQYTLTFVNHDFCRFLNAISQLQQEVFPFTTVTSIDVNQKELNGKGVIEFIVGGTIMTPERITQ